MVSKSRKSSTPRTLKVRLFSQHDTKRIAGLLRERGIAVAARGADIMLCYGGDGTFLLAEERYPGIPKLLVRKSITCRKCHGQPLEKVIARLPRAWRQGLRITEHRKLQAVLLRKSSQAALPLATNNIIVRNAQLAHALRFTLHVDGIQIGDEFIGDGIIVATPFGSTAYFQSATRQTFERGIGIAFNNTLRAHTPLLCDESVAIELKVNREEAHVSADTGTSTRTIRKGDGVRITLSKDVARIVHLG